ncbi:surface protease GP63 [Trypanosoma cruzi]|nr:surface protease GP63 [Trypanosoma cruzi]
MVLRRMGRSSARSTARCAPLPRTAAVLSFRVRWWVDRVTSKRRKQKSLRLLQGRPLRRILVHSCLLCRLVPPLRRSLPVLRLRVSLVVAFMPVRGVIRGCGPKVRTTLSGEGGDLAVEARESTEPPADAFFAPSPGEDVARAEGDPRADCPAVVPSASAPATPIPSVNSDDFQAIPDALVQQADSDCFVAAATAGRIPFVLRVVVAVAVVVVPL